MNIVSGHQRKTIQQTTAVRLVERLGIVLLIYTLMRLVFFFYNKDLLQLDESFSIFKIFWGASNSTFPPYFIPTFLFYFSVSCLFASETMLCIRKSANGYFWLSTAFALSSTLQISATTGLPSDVRLPLFSVSSAMKIR